MPAQRTGPTAPHVEGLDAIRGLAALTSVLAHLLLGVVPVTRTMESPAGIPAWLLRVWQLSPLGVLLRAHEAVMLFFTMSGFVLMRPWVLGRSLPYSVYVVRRVFRIWLPYMVALLAAALLSHTVVRGPLVGLDVWVNLPWQAPASAEQVALASTLVGWFDYPKVLIVTWSLVHEMRISLLFPLLAFFVLHARTRSVVAVVVAITAVVAVFGAQAVLLRLDLLHTAQYTSYFLLGALVSRHFEAACAWWRGLSRAQGLLAFGAGFFLYAYGHVASRLGFGLGDLVTVFGVLTFFVASQTEAWFQRFLAWRPIRALGHVSYSLYLAHSVAMIGVLHLTYRRLPWALVCGLMVLAIALATYALWRWVEVPSMEYGRRTAKALMAWRSRRPETPDAVRPQQVG